MESLKTQCELIQLVLKMEFTFNFCPLNINSVIVQGNQMPFYDVRKTNQSIKFGKHGKNNHDKLELSAIKPRRDKPSKR